MIYLDNAATTYPKPKIVRKAVFDAFSYSANPGRAGHKLSLKASEAVYHTRQQICKLLSFSNPEKVILTPSCTFALNTVIKGTLKKGDHVVISSLEHNSVLRPIQKMTDAGIITYDVAEVFEGDDERTLDSFRKLFRDKTKLCICTHASNVFGVKTPISRLSALCHFYEIPLCVDVSQTAGVVSIDIDKIGADYICAPGHKGLYGPMGTGFLVINSDRSLESLIEGGTGSGSSKFTQPDMLPDKFESGTLNLPGYVGLSAGVDFVLNKGCENICNHEMKLIQHLYDAFSNINGIQLYTKYPNCDDHVPLLSFSVKDIDCDTIAEHLSNKYGIALRSGLHCSPLAHKYIGSDSSGTIRVSPSVFSNMQSINVLINCIYTITKGKKISI